MRPYHHKGISIFLSPGTSKKNWSLLLLVLALLLPTFVYAAPININTADAVLLDTLPGIGSTKAAAIVSYREGHGPFKRAEDIQEVSGIGPATFAKLSALITVDPTSPEATRGALQPVAPPASSQSVQTVVTNPSASAHAVQTARAPRAATNVAALGAASATPDAGASAAVAAAAPAPMSAPTLAPKSSGSSHTGWLLGLLGVVVFAAAAFMIL